VATCTSKYKDPSEGVLARVSITAISKKMKHNYIESRPWPVRDCQAFVKEIVNLFKGVSEACISAYFISDSKNEKG